jgi:hypothetical protein
MSAFGDKADSAFHVIGPRSNSLFGQRSGKAHDKSGITMGKSGRRRWRCRRNPHSNRRNDQKVERLSRSNSLETRYETINTSCMRCYFGRRIFRRTVFFARENCKGLSGGMEVGQGRKPSGRNHRKRLRGKMQDRSRTGSCASDSRKETSRS